MTQTKSIKRGVSYGRVSTLDQVLNADGGRREDASPQAQKDRCLDHVQFLTSRKNQKYEIIDHLSDEGYSGKNTKRPAYQKMWRLISSNSINFVVTTELSRIGRSVLDFLELVAHCERHKVDLIVIGLDLDTSTPFGRVIVIILVALAQFEREMTSQRVKENGLNRLLKDGKINGAGEILGLDRDPKAPGHFLVNHEELIKVETLLKMFLKFSSKKKVLQEAHRLGLTYKNERKLTAHTLNAIFRNIKWRYRGLWYANKENENEDIENLPESKQYQIVKLPHGPLINSDLLNQVQEKLANTYEKRTRSGKNRIYLLSQLLEWENGAKYFGGPAKDRQYFYYYCKGQGPNFHCEVLEKIVIDRIKKYFHGSPTFKKLVHKAIMQKNVEIPRFDVEILNLEKQLHSMENENAKLRSYINDPDKSSKPNFLDWLEKEVIQIQRKKEQVENDLKTLRTKRQEIMDNAGLSNLEAMATEFIARFNSLTPIEKRYFVEKMVAKIVLRKDKRIDLYVKWAPHKAETEMTNGSIREMSGAPSRT